MIRLLFLPFPASGEPPLAYFIMKHLVETAGLTDKIYVSTARVAKKGAPLREEGRAWLTARGIPSSAAIPMMLEWKTYDLFNLLIQMDPAYDPALFDILGGDVDGKLHALGEYAGIHGAIADPYHGATWESALRGSLAGCQGLLAKLSDWVG